MRATERSIARIAGNHSGEDVGNDEIAPLQPELGTGALQFTRPTTAVGDCTQELPGLVERDQLAFGDVQYVDATGGSAYHIADLSGLDRSRSRDRESPHTKPLARLLGAPEIILHLLLQPAFRRRAKRD